MANHVSLPEVQTIWQARGVPRCRTERTFAGGLPRFNFGGYTLVDALMSYDAEWAGRFTLAVSNLLDERYITYFSQTATFVTNRDFVSGRGRAITLRWQGSF